MAIRQEVEKMNVKNFLKLLEERIDKTRQVLDSKNKEYASDTDKLHNFKRAGAMENCTPEKALVGMWAKHIISLLDIVDKIDADEEEELTKICLGDGLTKEMLEEKIGDAVNYLILLEALIKERYSW
jgi:hypothetical protein